MNIRNLVKLEAVVVAWAVTIGLLFQWTRLAIGVSLIGSAALGFFLSRLWPVFVNKEERKVESDEELLDQISEAYLEEEKYRFTRKDLTTPEGHPLRTRLERLLCEWERRHPLPKGGWYGMKGTASGRWIPWALPED